MNMMNPWWRDDRARPAVPTDIHRAEFDGILGRLEASQRAQMLVGLRRIGKSVLMKQIARWLLERFPATHLLYVDLEDLKRRIPDSNFGLTEIFEEYEKSLAPARDPRKPYFCLFDEIHASRDWSIHLKGLVDRAGPRIIATDSSAALLRESGIETGQGRWDYIDLYPWSFRDFATLLGSNEPAVTLLERYLLVGGFPEQVIAQELYLTQRMQDELPAIWHRLREDVEERTISRDLAAVYGVRREPELKALFVALVADSGALFDATARGSDIKVTRQKVTLWNEQLSKMGLLHTLLRREESARKSARAHPKVYAGDPSLVMAFSHSPTPRTDPHVRGQAMEAAVLRHLLPIARHHFGKLTFYRREQAAEIDFVLEIKDRRAAIEVKSSMSASSEDMVKAANAAREIEADVCILLTGGLSDQVHETASGKVREISVSRFLVEASSPQPTKMMSEWLGL